MVSPEKVIAVIPCLNEGRSIGRVVAETLRSLPGAIVVDDGSSDQTGGTAAGAGAEVIRHERTLGKGAALKSGFERAFSRNFAWAICLDGDGQHDPADIPGFLKAGDPARLVVGNRMGEVTGMPATRRWVNRWMSRRLSKVAGCELPDTQCGFRLVDLEIWRKLSLATRHFEIESELLLAFLAAQYRVEFVPIRTVYKSERSKIQPVRDAIRWFRWYGRARAGFERAAGLRAAVDEK